MKIKLTQIENGNDFWYLFKRGARADKIFIKESFYLLPCFCIQKINTAIIIWTHTRARRNGFAKKLVNLLNIQYVNHYQKVYRFLGSL